MGDSSLVGILKDILLKNIDDIKYDSFYYKNINYQAFNVYFQVGDMKYELAIELDSGVDIYLKHHDGFRKNGDLLFVPDQIMLDLDFHKKLQTIRKTIKYDYEARLRFMIELICRKINEKQL